MQTSFRKKNQSSRSAFTLTELWIVMVTLAILAALALPALAGKDRGFSIRTQCANQLRQIGVAVTAYAHNNSGYVLSCKCSDNEDYNQYGVFFGENFSDPPIGPMGFDQTAIPVLPMLNNLRKLVYLDPTMTNGVGKIWCCPSIPAYGTGLPHFNSNGGVSGGQWQIGYSYYGGTTWWIDSVNGSGVPGLSPVNLDSAKPYWALAADYVAKVPGDSWAIGITPAPANVPHRRPGTNHPDGANECLADGSVAWMKWEDMLELTDQIGASYNSWDSGIKDYMYQGNIVADLNAAMAANPTYASAYRNMLHGITTGGLSPTP